MNLQDCYRRITTLLPKVNILSSLDQLVGSSEFRQYNLFSNWSRLHIFWRHWKRDDFFQRHLRHSQWSQCILHVFRLLSCLSSPFTDVNIAAVVGLVIGLVAAIVIAVFLYKYYQKKREAEAALADTAISVSFVELLLVFFFLITTCPPECFTAVNCSSFSSNGETKRNLIFSVNDSP